MGVGGDSLEIEEGHLLNIEQYENKWFIISIFICRDCRKHIEAINEVIFKDILRDTLTGRINCYKLEILLLGDCCVNQKPEILEIYYRRHQLTFKLRYKRMSRVCQTRTDFFFLSCIDKKC